VEKNFERFGSFLNLPDIVGYPYSTAGFHRDGGRKKVATVRGTCLEEGADIILTVSTRRD
jgi:hypothetical protein